MKHVLATLALALLASKSLAQPAIQWQKSLGGNSYDFGYSAQHTSDGGYILAALSGSYNSGDVSGGDPNGDFWIVKLDSNGEIQWQNAIGGSVTEAPFSVDQTLDGGAIAAGVTNSNDGDVSGNHGGALDCWVVKLTDSGALEWQKALGGSGRDEARSVQSTNDGGYILTGFSYSSDGDLISNQGSADVWVVKLTATGSIQWQKSLGGSNADYGYYIRQASDGGYILAGQTSSNDGDVSGNHGGGDYWVVKMDSTGNIQWQKALGGTGIDVAQAICQTSDGGYTVLGYAGSGNSGDVTGALGGFDIWMVKLSPNGGIKWQKTFGGTDLDWGCSIDNTLDGGYIIGGATLSTDGDITQNDGGLDFWIVKTNSLGIIQWQKTLGGSDAEWAYSVEQTADNGYFISGRSKSDDGDLSENHGELDLWIVKLAPEATPTTEALTIAPLEIYPNPAHNTITLQTTALEPDLQITITDMLGRTIQRQPIQNGKNVDVSTLASGMYIITATAPSGKTYSGTFKKE